MHPPAIARESQQTNILGLMLGARTHFKICRPLGTPARRVRAWESSVAGFRPQQLNTMPIQRASKVERGRNPVVWLHAPAGVSWHMQFVQIRYSLSFTMQLISFLILYYPRACAYLHGMDLKCLYRTLHCLEKIWISYGFQIISIES